MLFIYLPIFFIQFVLSRRDRQTGQSQSNRSSWLLCLALLHAKPPMRRGLVGFRTQFQICAVGIARFVLASRRAKEQKESTRDMAMQPQNRKRNAALVEISDKDGMARGATTIRPSHLCRCCQRFQKRRCFRVLCSPFLHRAKWFPGLGLRMPTVFSPLLPRHSKMRSPPMRIY